MDEIERLKKRVQEEEQTFEKEASELQHKVDNSRYIKQYRQERQAHMVAKQREAIWEFKFRKDQLEKDKQAVIDDLKAIGEGKPTNDAARWLNLTESAQPVEIPPLEADQFAEQ